jgi:hypothetical protein
MDMFHFVLKLMLQARAILLKKREIICRKQLNYFLNLLPKKKFTQD